MPLRRGTALLALLALLALPDRGEAWGYTAHRMVNHKAIGTLPGPLRALFEANADYVTEHAIDPDLWREAGLEGEGPNHYLDMDAFGPYPFDAIPRVEAEHLARHGPDAVQKGRLPWRVAEVYRELAAAFRARDAGGVLERAAVLGHYVGDAHVPFHAILNYDGQFTGQTGVHERWESEMIERFERQIEAAVAPASARRVGDPVEFLFRILTASFAQSDAALASDQDSAGAKDRADTPQNERYDDGYFSKLYEREGERVRTRLASAATSLGSLWLSAWEEAGRPAMDTSFRFPYVRRGVRVLLLSLDGSSAPIIDEAVARGLMPNLARLRGRGAAARGSVTTLPSKTAPGHAALYTGAWSDRNGISGNEVAVPGGAVVEQNSGYGSTHLRAEPIWATAARQGLDATVASATQAYPFGPFLDEKRFGGDFGHGLTLFDGYQGFEAPDAVLTGKDLPLHPASGWLGELPRHDGQAGELELTVAGTRIDGLVYDDPSDPVRGFDTLYLGLDKDPQGGITLKPRPLRDAEASAFAGLRIRAGGGEAGVHFRLFVLSPDGSEILLYRTSVHVLRSSRARIESPAFEATGGFVGNGADGRYKRGELGPPLWEGGDGTAEGRYLETAALTVRQFRRLTDFCIDRTSWHLLLSYLPYPDETFHLWLGHLDPTLPGHDPALAARLRPFMDRLLRLLDEHVAHLVERVGPDTVVGLTADHGQVPTNRIVRPNVALAKAGLLALDGSGEIDLARSRAVYFPGNSAFVLINRASREGGIVRAEDEEEVRRQVASALRAIRDPEEGRAVVDVVDPSQGGNEPAVGGPTGGDLYLSLAPGYRVSSSLNGDVVEAAPPAGDHFSNPERPAMHAVFALAGPGVASGVDLGTIRQIDIAPTLCALLGIDPPAHATGTALTRALARVSAASKAAAR